MSMKAWRVIIAIRPATIKQFTILCIVFLLFLIKEGDGQTVKKVLFVKYISSEHVYLGGGKADGMSVGDLLDIIEDGKPVAELRVVYVAEHSASCEIVSGQDMIKVGSSIQLHSTTVTQKKQKVKKERRIRSEIKKLKKGAKSTMRVSGYLGIQWYQFMDSGNNSNNFSQPTARLKLKLKNLWDDAYNFRINARFRYNDRSRTANSNVPEKEWRNRLYEVAFSYEDQKALFNYKIGRIISNKFSGVGYIDGLLIQHNTTDHLRLGFFAGTQPEWQYSNFQTSLQKYGFYINYLQGEYGKNRYESTLALAGTYHGYVVSREFIYLQNNYNYGRRWSFYQSLELDVNRVWRKRKTGEALSITGFYANSRYNITDNMSIGLNYDNRKNYYTYEVRSLADSLFDSAFRHGLRLSFKWRFLKNYRFHTNAGVRKRGSDSKLTFSYTSGLAISNLFKQQISVATRFSGFSNYYTKGINPSITVSKYFFNGHSLSINYGSYFYNFILLDDNRLNQWIRLNSQIELPFRLYLVANYEYNWGDDRKGHQVLIESGYRF